MSEKVLQVLNEIMRVIFILLPIRGFYGDGGMIAIFGAHFSYAIVERSGESILRTDPYTRTNVRTYSFW